MAEEVIIVSGLPRSGTSMLMQILQAGGVEILCDGERSADDDNPLGYYEFEKVKTLKQDASWMPEAMGKAVKMISALLYDLPRDYRYKIIFMQRNIQEVLLSQKKMLNRRGQDEGGPSNEVMAGHFSCHLEKLYAWMAKQDNIEILFCDYNELLKNPSEACATIPVFLNREMDVSELVSAVDEGLYRNRMQNKC